MSIKHGDYKTNIKLKDDTGKDVLYLTTYLEGVAEDLLSAIKKTGYDFGPGDNETVVITFQKHKEEKPSVPLPGDRLCDRFYKCNYVKKDYVTCFREKGACTHCFK